jgi:hypothetical protein
VRIERRAQAAVLAAKLRHLRAQALDLLAQSGAVGVDPLLILCWSAEHALSFPLPPFVHIRGSRQVAFGQLLKAGNGVRATLADRGFPTLRLALSTEEPSAA